jgi:hypothetical protein
MQNILLTCLAIYLTFVGLMYVFQRKLMYHPTKNIEQPANYGLQDFSEYFIKTSDNVSIQLWYKKATDGFPTIIYFHGNAGNIAGRSDILAALGGKGFGVLATSYRGYGKSEGSPSEKGLYDDGRAALQFLTDTQNIPISRIMLFGESLGTGVATQIATEHPVAALLLQAPYTSVSGRAAEIYYFVPVKWLIVDRFESIRKISQVKSPVLIFHGERDEVIPVRHGRAMFEATTAVKQAYFMPEVHHNDFDSDVISSHVLNFAKVQQLIK